MMRHSIAATLVAGLLIGSAPVGAQSPWAKVPPLPTACYGKSDHFFDASEKVRLELGDLIQKQKDINSAIEAKARDVDPAAKQAAMLAFFRKDPTAAAKYMQDMASTPARLAEQGAVREKKLTELDGRLDALEKQRKTEQDAALGALNKKFREAIDPGSGNALIGVPQITRELNAAYEKHCAKWWGATSPFLPLLADYKKFEIEVGITYGEQFALWTLRQYEMMGFQTTGYKPTAEMEGVREYLRAAQKAFEGRFAEPVHQ